MKVSMKRVSIAGCFCIALALFVFIPSASHAVTPTPTPTPTPMGSQTDAIEIPNSIPNKKIDTNPPPEEEVLLSPTPTIKYHYNPGLPLNPSTDNFKVPAMDAVADWLTKTSPYMSAKQIKDNIIPHQLDNLFVSGKTKRCIYIGDDLVWEDEGYYETEDISYLPPLTTANGLLSSHMVRYEKTPIDGKYDFTGPAYKIDNDIELECSLDGPGTEQLPPKTVKATGSWVTQLLSWIRDELLEFRIVYVSKQQTPEAERIHCTMDGCVTDNADIDLRYVTTNPKSHPDEIARLQKSGGVVDAGFRAVFMDTAKSKPPHGQEKNFTETNTLKTKQMENSADLIKCSLVPVAVRGALGLTPAKCNGFIENLPAPPTDCAMNLDDLTVDAACKLKNNTLNIPANLVTAIEAAATAFKVPPSLMVGIIFGEGGFGSGSLFLDSSQVYQYFDGCTNLPNCDPGADVINNIVPFMQQYWQNLADAVTVIDPNREPNACNLIDGLFALAKDLARNQFGAPAFAGKTCFGIALNSGGGGSSSCTWSDSSAETAIRVWQFGSLWNNTSRSCATKLNSCFLGGGFAAQCPTGGDTCETVGNRYSQASHNGCIWNIYKSN